MPANTPNLALPYPVPGDTVDVPRDVQALAAKLDTYSSSILPPLVNALPGGPVDGQEVYFRADDPNGIVWHLRYRAASASAFKWEVIGGPPLVSNVAAQEAVPVGGYGALITAGPIVTLPLAGDYLIGLGFEGVISATNQGAIMSYLIGATAAVDADGTRLWSVTATGPRDLEAAVSRFQRKNALAAVALTAQYKPLGTTGTTCGNRFLSAVPIRVG